MSDRDEEGLLQAGEIRRNMESYLLALDDEKMVVQKAIESLDEFDADETPPVEWVKENAPPGNMPLERWERGEYDADLPDSEEEA